MNAVRGIGEFLCFVAVFTFFTGCGGGSSGPEGAVNKFLGSLKSGKIESAVSQYSPDILKEPGAKEKLTAVFKSSISEAGGIKSFSVDESSVDGDNAEVSYTLNYQDGRSEENTVNCVRVNGKWYLKLR
jgi:hypothetical protein